MHFPYSLLISGGFGHRKEQQGDATAQATMPMWGRYTHHTDAYVATKPASMHPTPLEMHA